MDRTKQIAAMAETEEERLLLTRLCERMERTQQRDIPASTSFLSPREQALAHKLLPACRFYGGIEGAERAVAYWLPDYLTAEDYFADGPIACLRASFYEEGALTHRDLLGALMGTGIRRDVVGDICLHGKTCDIFVLSEMVRYLTDNLTQAGRCHLRLEQIPLSEAVKTPQKLRQQRVTVASLRLDAVLSAAFHLSRSSTSEAIAAGRACINSLTCLKPDRCLSEGDELSLRGSGKLRVLTIHGETRKNRLALTVGIYE